MRVDCDHLLLVQVGQIVLKLDLLFVKCRFHVRLRFHEACTIFQIRCIFCLRFYLGCELPLADEASVQALERDPRVQAMPEYPYAGSVRKIGDTIVVKLG